MPTGHLRGIDPIAEINESHDEVPEYPEIVLLLFIAQPALIQMMSKGHQIDIELKSLSADGGGR